MSKLKFRLGDVCTDCGKIMSTAKSTLARELLAQDQDTQCQCEYREVEVAVVTFGHCRCAGCGVYVSQAFTAKRKGKRYCWRCAAY